MKPLFLTRLRDFREREIHYPTWRAIFISKFFLIRRGLLRAIRRHAPKLTGTVVDFGCGQQPYREIIPADRYIGLDVVLSGHPANQKKPDVIFDGIRIPLTSESVDAVLATEVFEHVFRLDDALREIHRILRPGGRLLITCPFCWPEHEEPFDYARYTRFALDDILTRAGYQIATMEKEGHFVHVLPQMALCYATRHLSPPNGPLHHALHVLYCSFFNLVGLATGLVFPKRWDLYFNTVVLAVKRDGKEPPEAQTAG